MLLFLVVPAFPAQAQTNSATLYLSPAKNNLIAGSTFDLSILLNTGGQAINAVDIDLTFPADKLQVIGPVPNSSFIGVWISQPSYSNTNGTIHLEGGIPSPGFNGSAGNVLTIQFRVRGTGAATVHFAGAKVLANDGAGTNILKGTSDGVFSISPKPLDGASLTSTSHPDSNAWYKARTAEFVWQSSEVSDGLSWVFDQNPTTTPGPEPKTYSNTIAATADSDGQWYFHLRLRSKNEWGATSHLGVKIDSTAPAAFTPVIEPGQIAINQRPIVTFATTDGASGIDHYEVRVESKNNPAGEAGFFTEQQSPYLLPLLAAGDHIVIVQAYDKAGNTQTAQATVKVIDLPAKVSADDLGSRLLAVLDPSSSDSIALELYVAITLFAFGYLIWLLILRRRKPKNALPTTQPSAAQVVSSPAPGLSPATVVASPAANVVINAGTQPIVVVNPGDLASVQSLQSPPIQTQINQSQHYE